MTEHSARWDGRCVGSECAYYGDETEAISSAVLLLFLCIGEVVLLVFVYQFWFNLRITCSQLC